MTIRAMLALGLLLGIVLPRSTIAADPPAHKAASDPLPRHPLELAALTDPDKALREISTALAGDEARQARADVVLLYLARANACRVIANWRCQLEAGETSVQLARQVGDSILLVRGLVASSRAYLALEDYARGNELLSEAHVLAKASGHPALLGDVFLAYSSLSFSLGKHRSARDYATRGLAAIGDIGAHDLRTRLLRNRARSSAQLGEVAAAEQDLQLARSIAASINDPKLRAEITLEVARTARITGDIDAQIDAGKEIIAISASLENSQLRGLGEEVMGLALLAQGDSARGQTHLAASIKEFTKQGLSRDELRVTRTLLKSALDAPMKAVAERELVRRLLALEAEVTARDRAMAADDYEARLRASQQRFEMSRLEQEAALAAERERFLSRLNMISSAALVGTLLALTAVVTLWLKLRRSHAELAKQTRRAEQLARSRAEFLARMTHEIRGPLGAILGYGERALENDSGAERMREALLNTQRSGRHLLGIVNDVLDASQLDAGQTVIRWEDVEPWSLSEDVLRILAVNREGKDLRVYRTAQTALPTRVHTDPLRLKQILLNLLGNAIKFTEAGEVELRLGASREHQLWWLEVRDTGIGMDAEQLGRLFLPYQQAENNTVKRYGGSGLGLYISKELVTRMNGQIQVLSTPGQGSTFRVEFPIGVACEFEWPDTTARLPMEPAVTDLPKLSGKALLADDDPDLRHLLEALLNDFGLTVAGVGDGSAALRAALRERFDVILLDVNMPEMDGLATAKALRKAGVDAPVVAITADAMREIAEAGPKAGPDVVLIKPVDRNLLHEHLRRWLPLARVAPLNNQPASGALAQVLAAARERFRSRATDEIRDLRQLEESKDVQGMQQRLHRLKGTAGFLEHHDLVAALGAAEAALAADPDTRRTALERVMARLQAL